MYDVPAWESKQAARGGNNTRKERGTWNHVPGEQQKMCRVSDPPPLLLSVSPPEALPYLLQKQTRQYIRNKQSSEYQDKKKTIIFDAPCQILDLLEKYWG